MIGLLLSFEMGDYLCCLDGDTAKVDEVISH